MAIDWGSLHFLGFCGFSPKIPWLTILEDDSMRGQIHGFFFLIGEREYHCLVKKQFTNNHGDFTIKHQDFPLPWFLELPLMAVTITVKRAVC